MESGINAVKQYFAGIRRVFAKAGYYYHAGIYGARNVCSKVCNSGLAESSYVSDMSTGFSGNLGYKIPETGHLISSMNISSRQQMELSDWIKLGTLDDIMVLYQ